MEPNVGPPQRGVIVLVLVFVGTVTVGLTSGPAAVVALPGIFGAVAYLLMQLRR